MTNDIKCFTNNYSALLSKEKLLRQLLRQHRDTLRNIQVLYHAYKC